MFAYQQQMFVIFVKKLLFSFNLVTLIPVNYWRDGLKD